MYIYIDDKYDIHWFVSLCDNCIKKKLLYTEKKYDKIQFNIHIHIHIDNYNNHTKIFNQKSDW